MSCNFFLEQFFDEVGEGSVLGLGDDQELRLQRVIDFQRDSGVFHGSTGILQRHT